MIIIQLILCSIAEKILSLYRASAIYILSGIGSVLFGSLINDKTSVGASGAAFGLCTGLVLSTNHSLDDLYSIGKYLTMKTAIVVATCVCALLFSLLFS
jgi:membrane associated rhomboid family serine protease